MSRKLPTPPPEYLHEQIKLGRTVADIAAECGVRKHNIYERLEGLPKRRDFILERDYTPRQLEIITGGLLGDGFIQFRGRTRLLPFYGIEHGDRQRDYLSWKYEQFKELCNHPPKSRVRKLKGRDREYINWSLLLAAHPDMIPIKQKWYPNGKKIVPPDIHDLLTPLALAVWFGDDGYNASPANLKVRQRNPMHIASQGFTQTENELLRFTLRSRYGINAVVKEKMQGRYFLQIPADSVPILVVTIRPHLPVCMHYKLDRLAQDCHALSGLGVP